TFNVDVVDDTGLASDVIALIRSNTMAAAKTWAAFLEGEGEVDIRVKIEATTMGRASGASGSSGFVADDGDLKIYEQGLVTKIQSADDVNGPEPDVEIQIDPQYLKDVLWLDPEPETRTTVIPDDRTDTVSMLMHEIGHAI